MSISLDSAVITNGTKLQLQRGETYTLTKTKRIDASNVTIEAVGSGAKPIIQFTGNDYAAAFQPGTSATDVTIKDLQFKVGVGNYAATPNGKNISLQNLDLIGTVRGFCKVVGAIDGLTIDGCNADSVLNEYWFWCSADISLGIVCKNITITNSRCRGSLYQNTLRFHSFYNVVVKNNCFIDPVGKVKSIFVPHDGDLLTVENNYMYGKQGHGPLNDGNGGINDPEPLKSQKMALRLKRATVRYNMFRGFRTEICAGVENALWDQNCVSGIGSGLFWSDGSYGTRPAPTGEIKNTKGTNGSKFVDNASPFAGMPYTGRGNTLGGTPV